MYSEKPLIADDTDAYDNEPMQKFGMLKWQVEGVINRTKENTYAFFPVCSAFTRLQFGGKRFCKCPELRELFEKKCEVLV